MSVAFIGPEVERHLSWPALCDALARGHRMPRAEIADSFLYRGADTMLSRAAWIDGLGMAVKTATVFPGNAAREQATVNGAVTLFADDTGLAEAMIDFHLVTRWKTAGDSVWAARRLARPGSRRLLLVGAGNVARALASAYRALFPGLAISIWNRNPARAEALAAELAAEAAGQADGGACLQVEAVADLPAAVAAADIIACATMATTPLLRGAWLRPGQHVDLVGAYRPDMREADDEALRRARIFVDSRETTLAHIGELSDPLARGVIDPHDIVADFYDEADFRRWDDAEITLFKNGGGAHLDLMTARYILDAARSAAAGNGGAEPTRP